MLKLKLTETKGCQKGDVTLSEIISRWIPKKPYESKYASLIRSVASFVLLLTSGPLVASSLGSACAQYAPAVLCHLLRQSESLPSSPCKWHGVLMEDRVHFG